MTKSLFLKCSLMTANWPFRVNRWIINWIIAIKIMFSLVPARNS